MEYVKFTYATSNYTDSAVVDDTQWPGETEKSGYTLH